MQGRRNAVQGNLGVGKLDPGPDAGFHRNVVADGQRGPGADGGLVGTPLQPPDLCQLVQDDGVQVAVILLLDQDQAAIQAGHRISVTTQGDLAVGQMQHGRHRFPGVAVGQMDIQGATELFLGLAGIAQLQFQFAQEVARHRLVEGRIDAHRKIHRALETGDGLVVATELAQGESAAVLGPDLSFLLAQFAKNCRRLAVGRGRRFGLFEVQVVECETDLGPAPVVAIATGDGQFEQSSIETEGLRAAALQSDGDAQPARGPAHARGVAQNGGQFQGFTQVGLATGALAVGRPAAAPYQQQIEQKGGVTARACRCDQGRGLAVRRVRP